MKPRNAVPWLAALAAAPLLAGEPWFLMSRHGECVRIETLARKVPDLGAVADPQSFAALMQVKGYATTIAPHPLPKGVAFDVRVPERDLTLLFVTADLCGSFSAR